MVYLIGYEMDRSDPDTISSNMGQICECNIEYSWLPGERSALGLVVP